MNMVLFQNKKSIAKLKKQTQLDIWTAYFEKKTIPKQWKDILIVQDSIKTQVIPQKYIKIANNQIQNLQIKNKEVYTILLESQLKEKPMIWP
jgi:hypothetical protein